MPANEKGRWPGDMHVPGLLTMDAINLPVSAVGDTEIDPARPISALKVEKQYIVEHKQAGAVVNKLEPVHVAFGATGELVSVEAGTIVLCTGTSTITIDVLKNGVTVLSAPLVLDSANTIRVLEAAGINPAADSYVAEDWFDVQITIATPTGAVGQGLIVRLIFREAAA